MDTLYDDALCVIFQKLNDDGYAQYASPFLSTVSKTFEKMTKKVTQGRTKRSKASSIIYFIECGYDRLLNEMATPVLPDDTCDPSLHFDLLNASIQTYNDKCFEWVYNRYTKDYFPSSAFIHAVNNGLEWVELLDERGISCSTESVIYALEQKKLDCFEYMVRECEGWNPTILLSVVGASSDIRFMKVLVSNGVGWTNGVLSRIIVSGSFECFKYCHENGCPWDEFTCALCAFHGKFEMLKYAHENGAPWDMWTCYSAAKNGYLKCLQYACENDCPLMRGCLSVAVRFGREDCARYVESMITNNKLSDVTCYKHIPDFLRDASSSHQKICESVPV